MKRKRINLPIVFSIATVLFLVFDRHRFILMRNTQSAHYVDGLLLSHLYILIFIAYGIFGIYTVLYAVFWAKPMKWQSFIPAAVFLLALMYAFILPQTSIYLHWNINAHAENRARIISLLEQDQLKWHRVGETKYWPPYPDVSRTGTIYVEERYGEAKILFYVYRGFISDVVLVYSSDDSYFTYQDFNDFDRRDVHTKKLEKNWYSAHYFHDFGYS